MSQKAGKIASKPEAFINKIHEFCNVANSYCDLGHHLESSSDEILKEISNFKDSFGGDMQRLHRELGIQISYFSQLLCQIHQNQGEMMKTLLEILNVQESHDIPNSPSVVGRDDAVQKEGDLTTKSLKTRPQAQTPHFLSSDDGCEIDPSGPLSTISEESWPVSRSRSTTSGSFDDAMASRLAALSLSARSRSHSSSSLDEKSPTLKGSERSKRSASFETLSAALQTITLTQPETPKQLREKNSWTEDLTTPIHHLEKLEARVNRSLSNSKSQSSEPGTPYTLMSPRIQSPIAAGDIIEFDELSFEEDTEKKKALSKLFADLVSQTETCFARALKYQCGKKFQKWYSGDQSAELGHTELMIAKASSGCDLCFTPQTMVLATKAGHLSALSWLYAEQYRTVTWVDPRDHTLPAGISNLMDVASEAGHLKLVEWLSGVNLKGNAASLELAAANGHLKVIRWLDENAHDCLDLLEKDVFTMDGAIANGHLGTAEYIWGNMREVSKLTAGALAGAARRGLLREMVWAHRICRAPSGPEAMDAAAAHGFLDVVEWLHYNRSEGCSPQAMDDAASNGHLRVVQWLHKHREEGCSEHAMDGAAENGHLDVVRWLHFNRSEGCSNYAFDWAAKHGHLETLKFLHYHRTEGCTERAMDWAAREGHLSVVEWLHQNRIEGCTGNIMDGPAASGHLEVCEWLDKHRDEAGCTKWAMDRAAEYGHLVVLKWLHRYMVSSCSTMAMDRAATNGHLHIVEWLHENRKEGCTSKAMDGACSNGHLDIVEWLMHHRGERYTAQGIERAARNNHLELIRWLYLEAMTNNKKPGVTGSGSAPSRFIGLENFPNVKKW
eukprot:CAMPEP_0117735112 /NCGR_PEP_ID=MMETSP0947-20121206/1094_1 /TAXON_ID=44440 /ORGANISM="Chattonella subsalsa, Strain CCMP2191" /LENGTH=838 /DNA_ID=CAMNT_0005550057 /DNA_START=34 /DNA_END=2547 /DNA_ORIENTATION=-